MRLIDLLPNGTAATEDAVYDAVMKWVESRGDWGISAEVDLAASDEVSEAFVRVTDVGPF